jgi:hypothetical protein
MIYTTFNIDGDESIKQRADEYKLNLTEEGYLTVMKALAYSAETHRDNGTHHGFPSEHSYHAEKLGEQLNDGCHTDEWAKRFDNPKNTN